MEHIHILLVLCWTNYWAKIDQILFVVCLRKGEGLKGGVGVCFPLCWEVGFHPKQPTMQKTAFYTEKSHK